MNQAIKKVGKYKLIRRIGSGASAQVFQGRRQDDNNKYAIKMIKINGLTVKQKETIAKQISIVKSIQHPNIVKLYESLQTTNHNYLIFQFCQNGDLQHYLKTKNNFLLSEKTVQKIMYCLSSAVECIHAKGIVHRDIKLANILLTKDLQIKLADFGFAKETQQNFLMKTYCGSPITMAPQILNCQEYNMKCDIWSLGIILYQLVYGKLPFTISNGYTAFVEDVTKKKLQLPKQPFMSSQFKELIFGALQKKANDRLSITQFHENKWIQKGKYILDKKSEKEVQFESVGDLLRSINTQQYHYQMKKIESKQITQTSEKSASLQLTVSSRVHRILYNELSKMYKNYVKSRESLFKQIQSIKSHKFKKLLQYLDYGYLTSISSTPLSIHTQIDKQQFLINQLKLQTPKTILAKDPKTIQNINFSSMLLEGIKDLNQSETPQYKKKYYQVIIQLLEIMRRFSFQVEVLFTNHHYQYISLTNILKILPTIKLQDNQTKAQGNFVTITMQVKEKNSKMRLYRESIKNNILNRIRQIEKEINVW